jgi:hypothetical protein
MWVVQNERNDRSDLNGRIDVECLHCGRRSGFWVNGWRKVSQNGVKYLSLALKPRAESAAQGDRRAN